MLHPPPIHQPPTRPPHLEPHPPPHPSGLHPPHPPQELHGFQSHLGHITTILAVMTALHTFEDLVLESLENELPVGAMRLPKGSPDPPLYMLIRVFLKGLVSYHESREKVKEDFLEIFPVMAVYDPPKDL
ncbi:hypothetical protein Bca4012_042422 [Brassica carinata]|uniref:BnaC09g13590D protein n=3 Tax=Brassica TaxID=3705 RepID=A0A078G287_BRANA|nr:hypothetical protein HID58_085743 [Brassica napus]CAF1722970.1 unnamed protein product [Brassica napus]CDY19544.1 BnaC09g13590D [Brassica napus]VDD29565.1 unnamed protein product [Brassica oleracea]